MFFLQQSTFWSRITDADKWLFVKINTGTANGFFDTIMPFMRESLNWVPLYLFLIVFSLQNFRQRGAWWILFFVVTVALTDLVGNHGFKHNFERIRPCRDPEFFTHVRLLVDHCSSGYSFTSNHAANHFGIASYFFLTMRPVLKGWAFIGLIWAAIISFAQVYVGVHYPFDILGGMLIGVFFGSLTGYFFNKRYGFAIFDKQPTL